jgi:hypothetical protein
MTKETVQVIAWTIEIIGLVAAVVGGRYLWKFAKRASAQERERERLGKAQH